jgi:cytochrome c
MRTCTPSLENPKGFANGTKMAFKLSKSEDRANLLAYLQTLSGSPVDFPTEYMGLATGRNPAHARITMI